MIGDPILYLTIAVSALAALSIVTAAALSGWRGWLSLRHQELQERRHALPQMQGGVPSAASRIEVADLKERIRKLEAIASGVDL